MLESLRLIALVANLANPLHSLDKYVLDTGLTAEDCAAGIAAGIPSSMPMPPAAILLCEPDDDSTPRFIDTGPHTFRTSWGESHIGPMADMPPEPDQPKYRARSSRKPAAFKSVPRKRKSKGN